jgi:hypothetical protein
MPTPLLNASTPLWPLGGEEDSPPQGLVKLLFTHVRKAIVPIFNSFGIRLAITRIQ